MIHSLFMLVSSYNKGKKISAIFIICWIGYMVSQYDFSLGKVFPIVNVSVFLSVSIIISFVKNRKVNTVLSIVSILIWSIIIDIICFYMFPMMRVNQSLIHYIFQGILFNYRYIFSNIIAVCIINLVVYGKNYIMKSIIKKDGACNSI